MVIYRTILQRFSQATSVVASAKAAEVENGTKCLLCGAEVGPFHLNHSWLLIIRLFRYGRYRTSGGIDSIVLVIQMEIGMIRHR